MKIFLAGCKRQLLCFCVMRKPVLMIQRRAHICGYRAALIEPIGQNAGTWPAREAA